MTIRFILHISLNIHSEMNKPAQKAAAACILCTLPPQFRTKTDVMSSVISEYTTKSKNIQKNP